MVQQTDTTAQHEIEVIVSSNGRFVWVNVDGVCALRIRNSGAAHIELRDMRVDQQNNLIDRGYP